jgi:hypothetical protein
MRIWLQLVFICVIPSMGLATVRERTIYYVGSEVRTSLFDGSQVSEDLILKKSFFPSQNLLVEIACVKKQNSPAEKSPVFMKVENEMVLDISTTDKFTHELLSGTGALQGITWDWNYLKFSMKYKTPQGTARIEDENWVSGKELVAIKELYWQDVKGGPEVKSGIITAKLHEISDSEFKTKSQELGCP